MKYVAYAYKGQFEIGLLDGFGGTIEVLNVNSEYAAGGLMELVSANANGDAGPGLSGSKRSLDEVRIRAPFPKPRRNVFCVGKNYYDHAHEFSNSGFDSSAAQGSVPKVPIIFSKVPECVNHPEAPIPVYPDVSTAIDYEAELTIIIGKGGRGISKADALDHVWGYTVINDVTARDLQGAHSQWLIGKSQDGFCPMGPVAVTADEVDLENAGIRTRVNGEQRQDSKLGLLIFDVPTLIETLSRGITLFPGDLIATGTPAGVGIGYKPPKYLQDGDVVEVEVDGIGTLSNKVSYQT
jgi:2-keto-4-pentenoate hydratase/2-oxohepta-3-ene-1,7-dioic acid hydratase in catechol pathway